MHCIDCIDRELCGVICQDVQKEKGTSSDFVTSLKKSILDVKNFALLSASDPSHFFIFYLLFWGRWLRVAGNLGLL